MISTKTSSSSGSSTEPGRWWPLLLPAAYLIHLAEEWWGGVGFAAWTANAVGRPVSETRFLVVNGIAAPVLTACTLLAVRSRSFRWFVVTFGTIVLVNGVLHLLGSLATASYSPGVVSGSLLYLPLGALALREGRTGERFGGAVALGLALHALVAVIAFWR